MSDFSIDLKYRTPGEAEAARLYPFLINDYCRELCAEHPALRALYYPDEREISDSVPLPGDGLGEIPQSPAAKLIRRYHDRAVVLTTGRCFVHCRFCFRKRLWKNGATHTDLTDEELDNICKFLNGTPEISDLLLSGGDVMALGEERVLHIVRELKRRTGIATIRICSRAPAVEPEAVTERFAAALGELEGVWFVTHFDHPDELTKEAHAACRRLVSHGVPVLDQTVLLSGVNDNAETLKKLFHTLASWRVKVHYLFHIDPVEGVSHFATGVEKGLEIMRDFRSTLSSLATPVFAIDLPEGGGKVSLTPDCASPDEEKSYYSAILHKFIKHPLA